MGTALTHFFFQIPSQYNDASTQISTIFQSAKFGHVFLRQCILHIDTCKKKKKKRGVREITSTSSTKKK